MRAVTAGAVLCLSACSMAPGYTDGRHTYDCYVLSDEAPPALSVEFLDGGRTARATFENRTYLMKFKSSIWPRFEDIYEGDGAARLWIDPEAYLTAADGTNTGPCQE